MSSRTVLSTSCNHDVALAAGIFNPVYGSIGLASRFWLRVSTSALRSRAQIRHHRVLPTLAGPPSVR
jgi:hypothetical protein